MHDDFFHLAGGFCFRRNEDGSITLQHRDYGAGSYYRVNGEITVPPNEFASAVAFVSARGEDGETFHEAWGFLTRTAEAVPA